MQSQPNIPVEEIMAWFNVKSEYPEIAKISLRTAQMKMWAIRAEQAETKLEEFKKMHKIEDENGLEDEAVDAIKPGPPKKVAKP